MSEQHSEPKEVYLNKRMIKKLLDTNCIKIGKYQLKNGKF